MRRAALIAFLAFLAFAPAAHAGVVQVTYADSCNGDVACDKYGAGVPEAVVSFTDPAGQDNAVSVSADGPLVTIADAAVPLTTGDGCTAVDEHTARCPLRVGGVTPPLMVDAGAGADAVTIGSGLTDTLPLHGGPGDDALSGGAETDVFDGGPGNDRMRGGRGDVLDYSARTARVTVDLAAGRGGGAGELDTVTGFHVVHGGSGNDRIAGTRRNDALYGERGSDRISGRGGNDTIVTDPPQGDDYYAPTFKPGNDVAFGGRGNDFIGDYAGGHDRFYCGPGRDTYTHRRHQVVTHCERRAS